MKRKPRFPNAISFLLSVCAAFIGTALIIVFLTGDAGVTQRIVNGVESRALAKRSTLLDRVFLKSLYRTMMLTGKIRYPRAAEFLAYYCSGRGDTLRFDAKPLLRNKEVQLALKHHKQAITFRRQTRRNLKHHVVSRTDWDLYYAFDLLFIKRASGRVAFYDQYYFQPLARKSRTPFRFGKVHFNLNDGLIHVAYPEAKMFTAYSEAKLTQADNQVE